jgi:hypothetical protein
MVADGLTGPEIARQLYTSPAPSRPTSHTLKKLGLTNRLELDNAYTSRPQRWRRSAQRSASAVIGAGGCVPRGRKIEW